MISYNNYINQEIVNKNDEVGTVLSFDKDRIVIKYPNSEKTYSTEIAIKTGFIAFKDTLLEDLLKLELQKSEEEQKKKQEECAEENEKFLAHVREINHVYVELLKKNKVLCELFGNDFKYPPLVEFEKKHQQILNKRNKYRGLLSYRYGYQDNYISDPFWR